MKLLRIFSKWRKSIDLSQELLVERIGAYKRDISNIVDNIGNFTFEILYLLVWELRVPLFCLFYLETSKDKQTKNEILQELEECEERELKIFCRWLSVCGRLLVKTTYIRHDEIDNRADSIVVEFCNKGWNWDGR